MCCEQGKAQPSHYHRSSLPNSVCRALALGFLYMLLPCSILGGPAVEPVGSDVLDLIQSLNISRADSISGLRYTTGPNNTPALLLEDTDRHIEVPKLVVQEALRLLRDHSEVTILAGVRQEVGDSGTILALASNVNSFLEIESSGRRDELRFHYNHHQQVRVETFPYRLADGLWHKLAVTLSGDQVSVFVDCNRIYQRVLQSPDRTPSTDSLSLFIGQRNSQHALFRGALQDVKIVTQAHGYLLQCPAHDTDCPTCAKFQDLEQRVKELSKMYTDITLKLSKAEERLTDLEQCQCLRSCHDNGTLRSEGQQWKRDNCNLCRCQNGTVECHKEECPAAPCSSPVYRDGECCPVCLTNCYYSGKYYNHGEAVSPRVCVTCTCDNGRMVCDRQDSEQTCPRLDCPKSERIAVHGQCCPVCKGTDFCSLGHSCHANASCINLATRYACQCHAGFEGDGHDCQDIDECQTTGGRRGHHCNGNSVCVNIPGSYRCDCQQGHNRMDTYECKTSHNSGSGPGHSCLALTLLLFLSVLHTRTGSVTSG
ncbi:hypothetical protein BsWGS_13227 [Bradybaena similaris]